MRIAIISDTHFGDANSVMTFKDQTTGEIELGSKYAMFIDKIRVKCAGQTLDYLILLGDTLDFSVSSYNEAYAVAQYFFQQLKEDNITKEIIYVSGNHDYDLWHTVEYQTNVTNRFNRGKLPKAFRQSIPGIIDDRKGRGFEGLLLHNVTVRKQTDKQKYAGLFLDHITKPETSFNFVYPNIYLITDEGTVILTHGQYLENYWSTLGEWGLAILNGDLPLKNMRLYDLREMVAVNFPLCQLNSSGLGQAGPLTEVVRRLEHEVKEKYFTRLETYFYRFDQEIKNKHKGITRFLLRLALKMIEHEMIKALSKAKYARDREGFLKDPAVCERVRKYYGSSVYEISEIMNRHQIDIPLPTFMIFGHTHLPIPWGSDAAPILAMPQLPEGQFLTMYNTGGWLNKMDKEYKMQFCGAEIFFYQSGEGFSSVSIR